MKLEVGKKYRNGKGETVEIVRHDPGHKLPFVDTNNYGYTEEGWFSIQGPDHFTQFNLIEEVTQPPNGERK